MLGLNNIHTVSFRRHRHIEANDCLPAVAVILLALGEELFALLDQGHHELLGLLELLLRRVLGLNRGLQCVVLREQRVVLEFAEEAFL